MAKSQAIRVNGATLGAAHVSQTAGWHHNIMSYGHSYRVSDSCAKPQSLLAKLCPAPRCGELVVPRRRCCELCPVVMPSAVAVLSSFATFSFIVGFSWTTFTNVPDVAGELFPCLTQPSLLAWTLNANNISQLLSAPYALSLLAWPKPNRTGLRKTMVLASAALLVQSAIWGALTLAPTTQWVTAALLVAGGAAGGCASAFTQGAVSHLSAAWFTPEARSTCTSVAYASQYAGQAMAFLMAFPVKVANDLSWILRAEALVALLLFGLVLVGFPDGPQRRSPSSADPAMQEPLAAPRPCGSHIRSLTRLPMEMEPGQLMSCILLGLFAAWVNGFFCAWSTTLPIMWARAPTAHAGALLAFAASLANPIGGALSGVIADRYFVRRLHCLLALCMGIAALAFAALVALQPPPPWLLLHANTSHVPPHETRGSSTEIVYLLPSVIFGGAAIGATMPTALELLAEVGHPLPPGASANIVVGLLQITATANTALVAVISPQAMNVVMLLSILLCALLLLPVRERYRRARSEGEERATDCDVDDRGSIGDSSPDDRTVRG